jgi:uncharacterized protein
MLSYDIRDTSLKAAQVEGELEPSDPVWENGDPRPDGAIRVDARLSTAGGGRFYLNGRLRGSATLECRRCLTETRTEVDEEIRAVFAPEGDDVSDPDVFLYDPTARELDLRPAVRELWLLSVPRYALCDEACKGLCAQCGKDLNTGDCNCEPARDTRWDALRKVATEQQS